MTGKTISEKILSEKSGRSVSAGDVVICEPDRLLGTDAATPMALDYFDRMGSTTVVRPERVLVALDHYAPPSSAANNPHQPEAPAQRQTQPVELNNFASGSVYLIILPSCARISTLSMN